MRFITEFECKGDKMENNPSDIKSRKASRECKLGNLIAKSFGWDEKGIAKEKWTLEIEAFPMDKWIEFKRKLFMECGMPEPNGMAILEMIKELEFHGKPEHYEQSKTTK